ncbi:preprotein translocase subunit YajC [Qipengyuania marisflavi]|uniref:Preprotein translocase subunit YajC n=1 Tax=Qipengyuania marisflavi TaxID=2486356 RepID=A0A5S3P953_9SPHN|nr:preprotein translocase subunit YajC [Qipengyuania marisflavi]TMM50024.1 preprotein translocase subunit YajC [Qipengyuania marisflavi]
MRNTKPLALIALAALAVGAPLQAQSYQGVGAADDVEADSETPRVVRTRIDPYVEVSQIFNWQLSPVDDFVTFTQLAAGVDASIAGRNNGGTVSIRYERNIAWENGASDSDSITGIARGYASIVPRVLTLEAGALASRTRVDSSGASVFNPLIGDDLTTQTYAVYAGPTLQTRVDDVDVSANYRIGYTRVDGPDFVTPGGNVSDVFDDSVTHSANLRAGTRPGQPFPVGVGVGAGYYQEDISNLDQRVRDAYVRGDVTIPISPTLAIVAGAGVEDVEVSSRDAVRDAAGNPVIGADGRYVTNKASPRVIAYEADGLIWDVGVIWRPSSRTALEAHFGHRYDSETFYGSFTWQPDSRSNFSLGVYDGIQGFGGRLNSALAALPTDFTVVRDPVTGDVTGCVNSLDGSSCLDGALASVRSAVFRGRGVAANYSRRIGRMTAGVGAGYDRRNFIAAPGTVLAAANGVVDESYYVTANVSGPIGERASFAVNSFASWFDSGVPGAGDVFALGTSASYSQQLYRSLSARAAVALTMLDSDLTADDLRTASALVGLRYDF